MDPLGDFLGKFKGLTRPNEDIRNEVVKLLKSEFDIDIEIESVKVRNAVVYLNVAPIERSEVFLHKSKILEKLKEVLKEKAPTDIR